MPPGSIKTASKFCINAPGNVKNAVSLSKVLAFSYFQYQPVHYFLIASLGLGFSLFKMK